MRDTTGWARELVAEAQDTEMLKRSEISELAFFQVELGLEFLATCFPGEPVGVLPFLLAGYVQSDPDLQTALWHIRHRMGDIARTGHWRRNLSLYFRTPEHVRAFTRTDPGSGLVRDHTTFTPRVPTECADRRAVFEKAFTDPLAYRRARVRPPAKAGRTYTFKVSDGQYEAVTFPGELPDVGEMPPRLEPVTSRTREPWVVDWEQLRTAAAGMDQRMGSHGRGFAKRLDDINFRLVDRDLGTLEARPPTFELEPTSHVIGLMNSGKSTMVQVMGFDAVEVGDKRVAYIPGAATSDVYASVSDARRMGLAAVPIVGDSDRGRHLQGYWRGVFDSCDDTVFPSETSQPDPAAEYTSATCLLEPLRVGGGPVRQPLEVKDFPCRGSLRAGKRFYDCPLVAVCPFQRANRDVPEARLWVMTPAALLATRSAATSVEMRNMEALAHFIDIVFIDEADAVQLDWESRFVQTERLIGGGDQPAWTSKAILETRRGLDRTGMRSVADKRVRKWRDDLAIHEQAIHRLYELLLTEGNGALVDHIIRGPFSAHGLFRSVVHLLFGIGPTDAGTEREADAERFFEQHLSTAANTIDDGNDDDNTDDQVTVTLQPLVEAMTTAYPDDERIADTLDSWLRAHADAFPDDVAFDRVKVHALIQAAIWTARITATFFKLAVYYPSVAELLDFPEPDQFWRGRPPADYRAIVPEAPIGNVLALKWDQNRQGGGDLHLLWVHGIGRWLMHHQHDLLAREGIEGPHTVLTSATSWAPGASKYHIPIPPLAILTQSKAEQEALRSSRMGFLPSVMQREGIRVSGTYGVRRHDALRKLLSEMASPLPGASSTFVEQIMAELDPDRRRLLMVTLSGEESEIGAVHINQTTKYTARHVTPEGREAGRYGLARRLVERFADTGAEMLFAAELSMARGFNILNARKVAALGGLIYLVRPHPAPSDLVFPLSLMGQNAMDLLLDPVVPGKTVADTIRALKRDVYSDWYDIIGRDFYYRSLPDRFRRPFVANQLVLMAQTTGRTIRDNAPTVLMLADAAFAERTASISEKAPDTPQTSILVATQRYLRDILRPPRALHGPDRADHEVTAAVWDLMSHLFNTCDLGNTYAAHRRI